MEKIKEMLSKQNVGKIDIAIRSILASLIGGYGIVEENNIWIFISALIFITVLRKNCFIYSLLGISSCKKE